MRDIHADIMTLITAGLGAVHPGAAVKNHLRLSGNILELKKNNSIVKRYDLSLYSRIFVIGAGKATASMALAVEEILGKKITSGHICVKYGYTEKLARIKTTEAGHPIPDKNGLDAAEAILKIAQTAGEDDLVISLISGGGSALIPLPAGEITLDDKMAVTDLLLRSGADIHEINTVRKHISNIKGGKLAFAAYPAAVINLMISDVIGDDMSIIASGPFIPDQTTKDNALAILKKYSITKKTPHSIIKHLNSPSTDIPHKDQLASVSNSIVNVIIASNINALEAAKKKASEIGYNALILSSGFAGDSSSTASFHVSIAQEVIKSGNPLHSPACILSGGETTVIVTGTGKGGRNLDFALHAGKLLSKMKNIIIASVGSDGSDGPTDAAGAWIDCTTVCRGEKKGLDIEEFIQNQNSYHFFKKLGDIITTGPTNTNVMDMRIMIILPDNIMNIEKN